MPIYEYVCPKCAAEFELLVRSSDEERQAACPACGAGQPERKLSTFAAPAAGNLAPQRKDGCGRCGDPFGPCAG